MMLPSRISELIGRIEAGETVTQDDVDRIASLQSLDIALLGEQFVKEWAEREKASNEFLESLV